MDRSETTSAAPSAPAKNKRKFALFGALGGVAVIFLAVGVGLGTRSEKAPHGEHASGEHAPAEHAATPHDSHGSHDPHAKADHHEKAHASAHGEGHKDAHEDSHATASHENSHGTPVTQGFWTRTWHTFAGAWVSVQSKVDSIQQLDEENERLRLENHHLRLELETAKFGLKSEDAARKTKTIEYKLDRQTGTAVGRDLASIGYRVPTHLVPSQLYTLGVSYFKAREDEKAAVIFTFLTGMEDNDTFKTPRNDLLTGVAWYRLDNFSMADRYFDRVLKAPLSEDVRPLQAHARLWKALVANRLGNKAKSQFWLTDLLDQHPHSVEASWVNPQNKNSHRTEAHRGLSSED